MLKPWDGGARTLDPTPGDGKERGEAEGCGGPAWRPRASRAVVDYAGMRVARGRPKGQRARARPLFLLNLGTERRRESCGPLQGRDGRARPNVPTVPLPHFCT